MKRLLLSLVLGLLAGHLRGMFPQRPLSPRTQCVLLMMSLEKKKFISEVTYNSIKSRSPHYLESLLTEINEESIETFNRLDLKERRGSQLNSSELEELAAAARQIRKTPSLEIFEEIHSVTKVIYEKESKEKVSRHKKQTQILLNILLDREDILKYTYKALLQAQYFDEYLEIIEKEERNLQALESFTEYINLLSCGNKLDKMQAHKLDASYARLISLKPLKTFESISRTIEWLDKNNKIVPQSAEYLLTTEYFLELYKALSSQQIDLFLNHYEHVTSNTDSSKLVPLTKDICKFIRDYTTRIRKTKPLQLVLPQPKLLTDLELESVLDPNLHFRTKSSDTITPRTGSPSPETLPEELQPYNRKASDPQSPAIDIKKNIKKLTQEPELGIFEK